MAKNCRDNVRIICFCSFCSKIFFIRRWFLKDFTFWISAIFHSSTVFFFISGTDLPSADFFNTSQNLNNKRSTPEFDDEDFGPESNVDAVDDVLSPTSKKYEENIFEDEGFEGHYNPFMDHQEKASLETENILTKKENEKQDQLENDCNHEDSKDLSETNKMNVETKEDDDLQSEFQQQLEDTQRMAREETPTPPADTGKSYFIFILCLC